jgi:hypothetical protein
MAQNGNGHAERRPDNQRRQPEELTMPIPIDEELFEKYFECLLAKYPRRDAADCARSALRKAFAESSDHGQTRCCLLDVAASYEAQVRAAGKTNFLRLDDFIRSGIWRPEMLPFNRMAA